jgi:hypothetical protein
MHLREARRQHYGPDLIDELPLYDQTGARDLKGAEERFFTSAYPNYILRHTYNGYQAVYPCFFGPTKCHRWFLRWDNDRVGWSTDKAILGSTLTRICYDAASMCSGTCFRNLQTRRFYNGAGLPSTAERDSNIDFLTETSVEKIYRNTPSLLSKTYFQNCCMVSKWRSHLPACGDCHPAALLPDAHSFYEHHCIGILDCETGSIGNLAAQWKGKVFDPSYWFLESHFEARKLFQPDVVDLFQRVRDDDSSFRFGGISDTYFVNRDLVFPFYFDTRTDYERLDDYWTPGESILGSCSCFSSHSCCTNPECPSENPSGGIFPDPPLPSPLPASVCGVCVSKRVYKKSYFEVEAGDSEDRRSAWASLTGKGDYWFGNKNPAPAVMFTDLDPQECEPKGLEEEEEEPKESVQAMDEELEEDVWTDPEVVFDVQKTIVNEILFRAMVSETSARVRGRNVTQFQGPGGIAKIPLNDNKTHHEIVCPKSKTSIYDRLAFRPSVTNEDTEKKSFPERFEEFEGTVNRNPFSDSNRWGTTERAKQYRRSQNLPTNSFNIFARNVLEKSKPGLNLFAQIQVNNPNPGMMGLTFRNLKYFLETAGTLSLVCKDWRDIVQSSPLWISVYMCCHTEFNIPVYAPGISPAKFNNLTAALEARPVVHGIYDSKLYASWLFNILSSYTNAAMSLVPPPFATQFFRKIFKNKTFYRLVRLMAVDTCFQFSSISNKKSAQSQFKARIDPAPWRDAIKECVQSISRALIDALGILFHNQNVEGPNELLMECLDPAEVLEQFRTSVNWGMEIVHKQMGLKRKYALVVQTACTSVPSKKREPSSRPPSFDGRPAKKTKIVDGLVLK